MSRVSCILGVWFLTCWGSFVFLVDERDGFISCDFWDLHFDGVVVVDRRDGVVFVV